METKRNRETERHRQSDRNRQLDKEIQRNKDPDSNKETESDRKTERARKTESHLTKIFYESCNIFTFLSILQFTFGSLAMEIFRFYYSKFF